MTQIVDNTAAKQWLCNATSDDVIDRICETHLYAMKKAIAEAAFDAEAMFDIAFVGYICEARLRTKSKDFKFIASIALGKMDELIAKITAQGVNNDLPT